MKKKKTEEKSRRSRAPTKGAGLVRASRPGSLPPTDTDSNALAAAAMKQHHRHGATLSYLDFWPA